MDKPKMLYTRGDSIRAMSNEQLAEWLCLTYGCTADCPGIELCTADDGKCNGMKKWLNKSALPKEDDFCSYGERKDNADHHE